MKLPKRFLRLVLVAAAAASLPACAISTPATRAAAAPQLYEPLPPRQKEAVMAGRIMEGMSPDAVYLALGRPDRVTRGSRDGKPFELWRYTELQPVYHTNFWAGWGYGPYGYRHRYYDPLWLGWDTGPDYIPVTSAVVRFNRNRVTGWERIR